MGTITLDDRDRAVLERLCRGDADVETLADDTGHDPSSIRDRLPELDDNGLVRRVGDDVYGVTDSGKRAIAGSPAGAMDDRIDAPPGVERRIESFDLRTDRAEAIRSAFAFLEYWGEALEGEIVDAVYGENPAGFESGDEWIEFVRDHLTALPSIEPPESDDRRWRYAGTPLVERDTQDGRLVFEDEEAPPSSARFVLERRVPDEDRRAAVRSAFDRLVEMGEASATEIAAEVYPDHDAGYDSTEEWWNYVRDAFESLPGVLSRDDDPTVWTYRQRDAGAMSTDPGAEMPDGPLGPDEEDGGESRSENG